MKNGLLFRKRRTDSNHKLIKKAFELMGCSVVDLSGIGKGCPDFLVSYSGQTVLCECKTEKGELTPAQVQFRSTWKGKLHIVRSVADVEEVHNQMWISAKLQGSHL